MSKLPISLHNESLKEYDFWLYMEPNPYGINNLPNLFRNGSMQSDEYETKRYGNKINDHLFIGDISTSLNEIFMSLNKIIAIVNVTYELKNKFYNTVNYHNINIDDDYDTKIIPYLLPAIKFINKYVSIGKNVLVHCFAGKSRSASICIAYLMWQNKWTYKIAYNYLKEKRHVIEPNESFSQQLIDYENEIMNYKMIDDDIKNYNIALEE